MSRYLDLVTVFLTIFAVVQCENGDYLNPDWVDPHDWSLDRDPLHKLCPEIKSQKCDATVRAEYLRLVKSLFNPNEFRFDDATQYFYRTVHIHVTKEQLEKLKTSNDPIYLDGLVSEVLAQTDFGTMQLVKEYTIDVAATVWNYMPPVPSLGDFNFNVLPRSRPIFINFTVLVLTYFLCRRFGVSYLIVLFFGFVYFLYEYLDNECHRRIELNEAVEFIYGKGKNPCLSPSKMSWYDWMVGRDSRSACRDFLDQHSGFQSQCGIIDLFYEFMANVVMKQLKLFFFTIADMVRSISTTNGILITAITLYFMKDLLVTIIKSVFKYYLNPTVWSRVVSDVSATPSEGSPILTIPDSSMRDINLGKALDLANKLLFEQQKFGLMSTQPSGIELLAVKPEVESSNSSFGPSEAELISSHSDLPKQSSQGSSVSFVELDEHEIVSSQHNPSNDVNESDDNFGSADNVNDYRSVDGDVRPDELNLSEYSTTSVNKSQKPFEISISSNSSADAESIEILSISSSSASFHTSPSK